MDFNPAPSMEIERRLIKREDDTEEKIKRRLRGTDRTPIGDLSDTYLIPI